MTLMGFCDFSTWQVSTLTEAKWWECIPLITDDIEQSARMRNIPMLGQYGCHFADDIFKCIFLSENGLVPNRRQAIIWINDDLGWWRIYASLGLSELNIPDIVSWLACCNWIKYCIYILWFHATCLYTYMIYMFSFEYYIWHLHTTLYIFLIIKTSNCSNYMQTHWYQYFYNELLLCNVYLSLFKTFSCHSTYDNTDSIFQFVHWMFIRYIINTFLVSWIFSFFLQICLIISLSKWSFITVKKSK